MSQRNNDEDDEYEHSREEVNSESAREREADGYGSCRDEMTQ